MASPEAVWLVLGYPTAPALAETSVLGPGQCLSRSKLPHQVSQQSRMKRAGICRKPGLTARGIVSDGEPFGCHGKPAPRGMTRAAAGIARCRASCSGGLTKFGNAVRIGCRRRLSRERGAGERRAARADHGARLRFCFSRNVPPHRYLPPFYRGPALTTPSAPCEQGGRMLSRSPRALVTWPRPPGQDERTGFRGRRPLPAPGR